LVLVRQRAGRDGLPAAHVRPRHVLFSVLIGVLMKSPQAVQGFGYLLMFPIVFGSNLLVPTSTMPG
jgi:hypothetical protein